GDEDVQRINADRGALAKEFAGAQARIADLRSRLDAAVGRDVSVRERTTQLRDRRERLDVVVGLLGRLETAERALRKNEQAVADAASEAGFDGAVSALAAVRTRSRRIEIEADLAAANDEAVRVRAILAEPEIVAVADTELGDVDAALTEAAEAEKTLEAAVRRQDQASARSAGVAQEARKVKKAVAAFGPVAAKHAWLSDLTEVMIGDGENSRRMSLRSYVLAARLEEVAVVASQRLRAMSGGRYDFVHTEATVKRERRGGLGLDILDANTGAVRPTSTLSGGETFMASLSLALGLADVVSEEAGGIQLETLFIDEGFGSLDAESLDTVMAVLDELRDGGRAVGVVSHVAEMKHRIPSRLYVAKSESGSTLRMTSAGAA
ncbi:MAG: SMC family ATPase, partial [Tomitella sp.]|nr:SMC family ATPase [Tomitella sp.]